MPATTATRDTGIRPFTVEFSEAELKDLHARISATRLPEQETVPDQSQGVQLKTIQELARYWMTEYDWRRCEERINAQPNFITEIDGLDIHFIHVRSKHEDALPLIVMHGWPGSVVEQLKIVDLLTNPTAHGASEADAFHLVIPSMPGFGNSGKPTSAGWGPEHIARAYVELMKRLGYNQFAAQGGDWGALIADQIGLLAPPELVGIHTNLPGAVPPDVARTLATNLLGLGDPPPSNLTDEERRAYDELNSFFTQGFGYALEMGLRPQTLYGLADSPIALAAWILDHDAKSLDLISKAFAGQPGGLSRDDVLDNITLFWLTNTGVSASRIYWENKLSFVAAKGVNVPVAVSAFPDELYQCPATWAEQAYPNLVYYNALDKGGHFAAWEQPEIFADEVRAGFRPVRG
jgi:pimeloyl-ACP methyl ester carboxylesterase